MRDNAVMQDILGEVHRKRPADEGKARCVRVSDTASKIVGVRWKDRL